MGRNYCLICGARNGRETGNSHTLNGNVNHKYGFWGHFGIAFKLKCTAV